MEITATQSNQLPTFHHHQQSIVAGAHLAQRRDGDQEEEEDDDDEEDEGQYPNPMNDPFAEIEDGWRKSISTSDLQQQPQKMLTNNNPNPIINNNNNNNTLQQPHSNDQVLNQLGHFSFNNPIPRTLSNHPPTDFKSNNPKLSAHSNPPLSMNLLSMRRTDQPGLFRPPNSSSASKNSFSMAELTVDHSTLPRTRLSSFSTDLEPISASPTSPNFPYSVSIDHHHNSQQQKQQHSHYQPPASKPPRTSRASLPTSQWPSTNLSSSCSSSFSSSDDGLLLRRASSSSLASVASVSSSTNGLKARRGLTKPLSLSLAAPPASHQHSTAAQALATPLRTRHDPNTKTSAFSRSLPPSPRLGDLGQARAQFVGMKANVTGGFSMKRRTSIPRLSLGGISSNDNSRVYDPVRLIGRNNESVMNTPVQLHFDPVAAGEGRQELMSSQAGVGGKGHIEVPSELQETFPYEYGPKEVLPDVFLGSEQNARDGNLLSSMGFGLIINVAKEVECPWEAASSPAPIEQAWPKPQPNKRGLMVRPTASTPNLKRSFEGKIRVSLPEQPQHHYPSNSTSSASSAFQMKRLNADCNTSRPSLDYIKLPWSHDQDGLAEIFSSSEVFSLIDRAREHKLKTLIHCQCGVSRSATFIIGYCMREAVYHPEKLALSGRMHDAYTFVKEKSPWAGPNMGLIYQLIEYEKVLLKSRREIVEEEDEEAEDEMDKDVMAADGSNGMIAKPRDDLENEHSDHDGAGGGDGDGDHGDNDDDDHDDQMERTIGQGFGQFSAEAAAEDPDSEMLDLDPPHRAPTPMYDMNLPGAPSDPSCNHTALVELGDLESSTPTL